MGTSGIHIADPQDGTPADVISTAPVSDTGQAGLAVRVISQLGAGSGGGSAVTVADGADVALGAVADVAWSSGSGTVIGLLKKLAGLLAGTLTVGTHGVTIAPPTAVVNGGKNISVTGTAVQFPSGACNGVVVTANSTNAASIFVGTSAVTKDYGTTTSGAELQPGQSVGLAIDNLNRVYVNGTSGDGVNWLAS